MTIFQALILGIIQGFTELLPISSSAHLALTPWLLGWPDSGLAFDVALHLGTLIAIVAYFHEEWRRLILAALSLVKKRRARTEIIVPVRWILKFKTQPRPSRRWPTMCRASRST